MNQIMKRIKAAIMKLHVCRNEHWLYCDYTSEVMGAELSSTKWLYQYLAVGGAYRNAHIWGNKHRKSAHYFNAKSTVKRMTRHTYKHVRHMEQDTSDPSWCNDKYTATWHEKMRSQRDDVVKHHLFTNLWREESVYLFCVHQVLEKRREHLSSFIKGFESAACLNEGFHCPAIDISIAVRLIYYQLKKHLS